MSGDPWDRCGCGHIWLLHDIEESHGDGTEMCCVEGCDQTRCPGRSGKPARLGDVAR